MTTKSTITLILGTIAVFSLLFVVKYLSDINYVLLVKLFPKSSYNDTGAGALLTTQSMRLHSFGFALATISILLNYKTLFKSGIKLDAFFVYLAFSLADGFVNVIIFQKNLFNTIANPDAVLATEDYAAIFYGMYTALIMFFLGLSMHNFILSIHELIKESNIKSVFIKSENEIKTNIEPQKVIEIEKKVYTQVSETHEVTDEPEPEYKEMYVKVIELYKQGYKQTDIAKMLNCKQPNVAYHLSKYKKTLNTQQHERNI